MRNHRVWLLAVFAAGGCGYTPPTPTDLIPVSVVVNTLKCEMAGYLVDHEVRRSGRIVISGGAPAEVTLTLNVVDSNTVGFSIEGAKILAFSPGLTILPSLTTSVTSKNTVTTILKLSLDPSASNTNACNTEDRMENGIGLTAWLRSVGEQIDSIQTAQPLANVGELSFTAAFGVTRSTTVKAGFQFVPLTASPNAVLQRDDTQTIAVKLIPRSASKSPKGGGYQWWTIPLDG